MNKWISVIETPTFTKITEKIADSNVIEELVEHIAKHPESGEIIEGTGGCRKLRWKRRKESGKSGGMRVIYYFYNEQMPIYFLLAYPKNVLDNITTETKHSLKQMVKNLVEKHKGALL